MKYVLTTLFALLLFSCIPLKIAPKIEDYKVVKGKRFQKKLPKQQTFIFTDPKKANEFYQFLDAKIGFDNLNLDYYLPININNNKFFLSYYEVERTTKTLNLLPILFDASRLSKGKKTYLDDFHTTENRKGTWYIAITIHNEESTDCLNTSYNKQDQVISYLKRLKEEYLSTSNYAETQMIKQ